jgi:DNA-binding transcriptional regulator YhcF (GntR family)
MIIETDESREEPVYRQVARQIREKIAFGQLPAGHRLPSVRTLASDLGVNLNTVARAYRVLEEEGFVRIRGRSGAEVAAPGGASSENEVGQGLRESLREVLARLRQKGLDLEELREVVLREIESLPAEPEEVS